MKNPAIQQITLDLNLETGEVILIKPKNNPDLERMVQFVFHGGVKKYYDKQTTFNQINDNK